jgi:hypothetical protein
MFQRRNTPRRIMTIGDAEVLNRLRCRGRSLDIQDFHLKDHHGMWGHNAWHACLPIGQLRTDGQAPSASHPHAEEAALKPRNNLAPAQVHAQRLALVVGTPELVSTPEEEPFAEAPEAGRIQMATLIL